MAVTRVNTQDVRDSSLTHEDVAAANKDGLAATSSFRTLGAGGQQACSGNDLRLSDARAPIGHHLTHEAGGSDPIPGGGGGIDGHILLSRVVVGVHSQIVPILSQTFTEEIELVVDYKIENKAGAPTNYYLVAQKGVGVDVPAYSNVGLSMVPIASGGIGTFSPPLNGKSPYVYLNSRFSVSNAHILQGTTKIFYAWSFSERPVIMINEAKVDGPTAGTIPFSSLTGGITYITTPNNFTGLKVVGENAGSVGANSVFCVYKRRKA